MPRPKPKARTKPKRHKLAPPEDLDGEALLEWDRVCDELAATGRLESVDRAILVMYVEAWADHRAAARVVRVEGQLRANNNGTMGAHPAYKVKKEMAAQIRRLLNDLGMTPAARSAADIAAEEVGELEI